MQTDSTRKAPVMKIALAQLNPTVGDIAGNKRMILAATECAVSLGADLVVCSELVVCGYPPKDLLLREGFAAACDRAVQKLAGLIPKNVGVIVGHPTQWNVPAGRIANAARLIENGKVLATVHKLLLPNYDVFDERRYFRPADRIAPVVFRDLRIGLHICEDAWWGEPDTFHHTDPLAFPDPVVQLAGQGANVLINVSASPFNRNKLTRRDNILKRHVLRYNVPFLVRQPGRGKRRPRFRRKHSGVHDSAGKKSCNLRRALTKIFKSSTFSICRQL